MSHPSLLILSTFFIFCLSTCQRDNNRERSELHDFQVEILTDSIAVPFGIDFLPDGNLIVSDRPTGQILILDPDTHETRPIKGLREIFSAGDGGILDIRLHPDFKSNHWLYYSFSVQKDSASTMVVERAKLSGDSLSQHERLFTAYPYYKEPNHFGNRLVFHDGYLFFSMGDRYDLRDSAQTLGNHLGKILRIRDDGSIPDDNPFRNVKNAMPEIWSRGHRNPQGLMINPATGDLWEHEHGPRGGDEINIIRPGQNYGWPLICWGVDYDNKPIGDGQAYGRGLQQPAWHYNPSIAPGGGEFYSASAFPKWNNNLFVGALAMTHLNRLVIRNDTIVHEERLLKDHGWRVRAVRQGPDGNLYLGIDGGKIVRLKPIVN